MSPGYPAKVRRRACEQYTSGISNARKRGRSCLEALVSPEPERVCSKVRVNPHKSPSSCSRTGGWKRGRNAPNPPCFSRRSSQLPTHLSCCTVYTADICFPLSPYQNSGKNAQYFWRRVVSTSDFSTQSGMETKTFTLLTRSKRLWLLSSRQRPRRQTCRRTARVRMMRPSSLTISAKVTAPTGSLINYILPFIEERSLPCWDLTVLARPRQWKRWRDTEGPIKGVFASWGAIPYAKPSH